ncbi:MAG: hypothetical protein ACM32E_30195 [Gemmatimonadota bacterium]
MLIIVGALIAICLLAVAERLLKVRQRARQRQQMAYRLSKAAARAEVAERKRKATAAASAELTSVMPAINQPKPTFDGVVRQAHRTRILRLHGSHSTGPQRVGTGPQRHGTGPQRMGAAAQRHSTGPQRQDTGPQRRPGGTAAARPRCQEQRPAGEQGPAGRGSSAQGASDNASGQATATPPGGDTQAAE